MQKDTRYRLYVDESGDHTFTRVDDANHRYLGLLGIWFDTGTPYKSFARDLSELKASVFGLHPDDPTICFHRKDILERRGIFGRLRDPRLNELFCQGLTEVVSSARFTMTCVVIDKASHRTRTYKELHHPYHYCLAILIERYADWLRQRNALGDVMAESRGKTEDQELQQAFETTLGQGVRFHPPETFQQVLTSSKLKLRKKEHVIPGLELADLLAYPFKREIIAERVGGQVPQDFSSALLEVARPKMTCQMHTGRVAGYGKVWLD